MKLAKKILPLIPLCLLLASCGQTEQTIQKGDPLISEKQTMAPKDFVVYPDDRPSIPDGKLVYEKQNCASCHGAGGEGGSGPALTDNRAMSGKKPVDLYKELTYGKDDFHHMQKKLSTKDTWNLVAYTRSLACPPLTQARIDEINAVFGSNCAVCHGTKGDGDGPLARNLEPSPANFQTFRRFYDRTDDTLFDHIANGIKWEGMPNFLGKEDKKKNVKFDHAYIRELVQYVRNFHISNEATQIASASTGTDSNPPASQSKAGESKSTGSESAKTEGSKTESSKTDESKSLESKTEETGAAASKETTAAENKSEAGSAQSETASGDSNAKSSKSEDKSQ